MSQDKYAAAVCCIDGRFHQPLTVWAKKRLSVDNIDLITEAGPDKIISENKKPNIDLIKEQIQISINLHNSMHVIIAAHDDCAANRVSPLEHCQHLKSALKVMKGWKLPVELICVFIDADFNIEEI